LREATDGRLEILMPQRAAGLAFMGGLWVFPGGRSEDADLSVEALDRVAGTHSDGAPIGPRMLGTDGAALDPKTVLGLHVTACRETFEEAGVLLARPRAGHETLAPEQLQRALETRDAGAGPDTFLRMLQREDLLLSVDRLVYWAHWITPSFEKRRFDTRFFAVLVPSGQDASVDRSETTRHAWVDEITVRARTAGGDMKMAPPTLATLQDLFSSHRRHGSAEAMLEGERARDVPAILPKIVPSGDAFEVVLPWDPAYAALPGEGCAATVRCPEYLATLPTRRALRR
jgi:8-oxo-dGTP pyrophosphatase MutT (NUDIX family)